MSIIRQIIIAVKNDWPLKVISILLAMVLWRFVVIQQLVHIDKTLPIEVINAPSGLVATVIQPPQIKVQFAGRQQVMDKAKLTQTRVVADLSGRVLGENPVVLEIRNVPPGIRASVERQMARVTLDAKSSIQRSVTVETIGKQTQGFRLETPSVQPETVTIEGASSELRGVARAVAPVDISGLTNTVQKEVTVELRDERNVLINGLRIQPAQVQVTVPIRSVATKTVPITPQLSNPPAGYEVASVQTSPSTVTITGDEAAVADVEYIRTVEISIGDLYGRGTFTPTLVFPEGIESVGVGAATVKVTTQQATLPQASEKQPPATGESSPTPPKPGLSPGNEETPQPTETGPGAGGNGEGNTAGG